MRELTDPGTKGENRGKFARDVIALVSGTTFAQAVSLLVTPILTRLYLPEAFGLLALFVSLASLLSVITCLRYEFAIPMVERDEDAAALVVLCLVLTVLISMLAGLALAAFHGDLLILLNAPGLAAYVKWVPWFICLCGFTSTFNYWQSRNRQFGRIATTNVLGAISTSGTKVFAGLAGYAHGGSLIGATVAGQAIATGTLGFLTIRKAGRMMLNHGRPRGVLALAKRYRKFPLYDVWGALINNASWQIPTLLFSGFFSPAAVGFYALAFRFIQLPMSLIGNALGQAFYPRIASAHARGETWNMLMLAVFRRLVALALFPAILFAVAGPDLFAAIFGQAWSESGVIAQILSLWVFWWFISSPLSLVFNATERQDRLLVYHMVIFTTRLAAILIGSLRQDLHLALWLFSITGALVYGALMLDILHMAKISLRHAARAVQPYLLIGVALGLIVMLGQMIWNNVWATTSLSVITAAVYFAFAIRHDQDLFQHLMRKRAPQGTQS